MYSIDLNINHDQLVELNSAITTGLDNFTAAAARLDVVSRDVKDSVSFTEEITEIKAALKLLSTNLTTTTTAGLTSFTTSLNEISQKTSSIAKNLHVINPDEVNGAVTSIKTSLSLITRHLADAVKGLDINIESVKVGKINLDSANGSVESVEIKLVKVDKAPGEVNLAAIGLVTVEEATGVVRNVDIEQVNVAESQQASLENVNIKLAKVEESAAKVDLANIGLVNIDTAIGTAKKVEIEKVTIIKAKATRKNEPVSLTKTPETTNINKEIEAAGAALVDSINQINKELISSSSGVSGAVKDFISGLEVSGKVEAADVIDKLEFIPIDLAKIITEKIVSANLEDILKSKLEKVTFVPQNAAEAVQDTGVEDKLNEFARFLGDASNTLDEHSKDFAAGVASLGTIARRITAVVDSTRGFGELSNQIKSHTEQLNLALGEFVATVKKGSYSVEKGEGKVVEKRKANTEDIAELFAQEIAKSSHTATRAALSFLQAALTKRVSESEVQGKDVSLNESNKDGILNDTLINFVEQLNQALPRSSKSQKEAIEAGRPLRYSEEFGELVKGSRYSIDDYREFGRQALQALKESKNLDKEVIKNLAKASQETIGNNMVSGGYLSGREPKITESNPGLVRNLNPNTVSNVEVKGADYDIQANAFKEAQNRFIKASLEALNVEVDVSIADLLGFLGDKTGVSAANKDLKKRLEDRRAKRDGTYVEIEEVIEILEPPAGGDSGNNSSGSGGSNNNNGGGSNSNNSNNSDDSQPGGLSYFQQLTIAKNKLTTNPSIDQLDQFPDPEEFEWEDISQLEVELSNVAARRYKNILTLLSHFKKLETAASKRGNLKEAQTSGNQISKLSYLLGEAGNHLDTDSIKRVEADNDTQVLKQARYKVGRSKLDDKKATKTLEDLGSENLLTEEGRLKLEQLFQSYNDYFKKGEVSLTTRLNKEFNRVKSLVNGADNQGEAVPTEKFEANDEDEKVLVSLHNQRIAKLVKTKKKQLNTEKSKLTRSNYLEELDKAEELFNNSGVISVPAAPAGLRDLKSKRDSLVKSLQAKLATSLEKELEIDLIQGVSYQELIGKVDGKKHQLGNKYDQVLNNLDNKIKSHLDKKIESAISVNHEMLMALGVVDTEQVSHVSGGGFGNKYGSYIADKINPEIEKSKKASIKANTKQAEADRSLGKDYSENLAIVAKINPELADELKNNLVEKSKNEADLKVARNIKDIQDIFRKLLKSDQFSLAKKALEMLKTAGAEPVDLSLGFKELQKAQLAFYSKNYKIAKDAGKALEQNEALEGIRSINPDIALGLENNNKAKVKGGNSVLSGKLSKAKDLIILEETNTPEFITLLEEIKQIDEVKKRVIDRLVKSARVTKLVKNINDKLKTGDTSGEADLAALAGLDPLKAQSLTKDLKGKINTERAKAVSELIKELNNAVEKVDVDLVKRLLKDISDINEVAGKAQTTKANKGLVKGLYAQLISALENEEQNVVDELTILIDELEAGKSDKAKSSNDTRKIKEIIKALNLAKKNLSYDDIDANIAAIKKISPDAAKAAEINSKAAKVASLNRDIDLALIAKNEMLIQGNLALLSSIDPVAGKKATDKVNSKQNSEKFLTANEQVQRSKEEALANPELSRGKEVTKLELFPEDLVGIEADLQADKLVLAVNNFFRDLTNKFDRANLVEAQNLAKLGDSTKLKELYDKGKTNTPVTNQTAVNLAYKRLSEKEDIQDAGLNKKQRSIKDQLNAQMIAALSDTTADRVDLINDTLKEIAKYREKNRDLVEKDKLAVAGGAKSKYEDLIPDGSMMDNSLKAIENRGKKGIMSGGDNPFKLQDLAGLYYTVYNLTKNIKDFAAGVIAAATSVSTELLRLNVVNSNNSLRTAADVKTAAELAKKYGGSQASLLSGIANFKTADILQYDRFGQSQGQKYGQGEIVKLVEGLNAAYSVNQLSKSRRDDANAAITQVFAKGTVNSEEIKRQLANQIPGALSLFAQAVGMSTGQFVKAMERNEIDETRLFQFGSFLERTFGKAASVVNLNNEVVKLGGKAADATNSLTQPIGSVALPVTMLLNKLFDGLVANGSAFTIGLAPLALIMSATLFKGLAGTVGASTFGQMMAPAWAEVKANKLPLGALGGGLALATAGSAIFGTTGLDDTINKLGKNLGLLSGSVVEATLGIFGAAKDSKLKESPIAKALFELAPLAAAIFSVVSYSRSKGWTESAQNKLAGLFQPPVPARPFSLQIDPLNPAPTFSQKASSTLSSIKSAVISPMGFDIASSILAAAATYAIANTTFISKYEEITSQLAKELSSIPKESKSALAKEVRSKSLLDREGYGQFNLDSINKFVSDRFVSVDKVSQEELIKRVNKGDTEAIKEAKRRDVEGFRSDYTWTGAADKKSYSAAIDFLNKGQASKKEFLDDKNYENEKKLAKELRAVLSVEKEKLFQITLTGKADSSGRNKSGDIIDGYEEQSTIVKKLESEYRQKITETPQRVANITGDIKAKERQIENITNDDGILDEEKKLVIDSLKRQTETAKDRLVDIRKEAEFIDPRAATDRKLQLNEARLTVLGREEIYKKASNTEEQTTSFLQRFNEFNDSLKNARDAKNTTDAASFDYQTKLERFNIATENSKIIRTLPEDDKQRDKLEKVLVEEANAMEQLKAATLALTQAQMAQQQVLEANINKEFDRFLKNYGREEKDIKRNSKPEVKNVEATKAIETAKKIEIIKVAEVSKNIEVAKNIDKSVDIETVRANNYSKNVEIAKDIETVRAENSANNIFSNKDKKGNDVYNLPNGQQLILAPKNPKISQEQYDINLKNSYLNAKTGVNAFTAGDVLYKTKADKDNYISSFNDKKLDKIDALIDAITIKAKKPDNSVKLDNTSPSFSYNTEETKPEIVGKKYKTSQDPFFNKEVFTKKPLSLPAPTPEPVKTDSLEPAREFVRNTYKWIFGSELPRLGKPQSSLSEYKTPNIVAPFNAPVETKTKLINQPVLPTQVAKAINVSSADYRNPNNLNPTDIIKFGTIDKAIAAYGFFNANIAKFKLSAEEASDKLVELRTNLVTTTLAYLDQTRQQQTDRFTANNLVTANTRYTSTFSDSFNQLGVTRENSLYQQNQNRLAILDTKKALSFTDISSEERANLAVKLIALETEAIRKKHEVEMAGIEISRAAYANLQEKLTDRINEITARLDSKLTEKNKEIDKKLAEVNNTFNKTGGEYTQGVKLQNILVAAQEKQKVAVNERKLGTDKTINSAVELVDAQGINQLPAGSLQVLNGLKGLSVDSLNQLIISLENQFKSFKIDNTVSVEPANIGGLEFPVETFETLAKTIKTISTNKAADAKDLSDVTSAQVNLDKYKADKQKEIQDIRRKTELIKLQNDQAESSAKLLDENSLKDMKAKTDSYIARRDKKPESSQDKITPVDSKFNLAIKSIEDKLAVAQKQLNQDKEKLSQEVIGGLPIDREVELAKQKQSLEAMRSIGAEKRNEIIRARNELLETVLSLPTTLNTLLTGLDDKIKAAADSINNYQAISNRLAINEKGNIAETIPEVYKDNTGIERVRNQLAVEQFDPSINGSREQARLKLDILKQNRGVDSQLVGLKDLQKTFDGKVLTKDDLEKSTVFQAQSELAKKELRRGLDAVGGMMSPEKVQVLISLVNQQIESTRILGDKENQLLSAQAKITNGKYQLQVSENNLGQNKADQNSIQSSFERSSYNSFNRQDDLIRQQRELARIKLAQERQNVYDTTTDPTARLAAEGKYSTGIQELDDQSNRMTEYGGRFVSKIEEAVSSAARLSEIFRGAIEKGDWRYVLGDILSGIVHNLADSFGKDASNNLAGMAVGAFRGLFGVSAGSTGISPTQGYPSYRDGYSGGISSLPSYSLGTMGSAYPRTPIQDPREPTTSHLAVINKDELVLSADQTRRYLGQNRAMSAVANAAPISNSYRNSQDSYISNNYSNIQVVQDTFGRNNSISYNDNVSRLQRQ